MTRVKSKIQKLLEQLEISSATPDDVGAGPSISGDFLAWNLGRRAGAAVASDEDDDTASFTTADTEKERHPAQRPSQRSGQHLHLEHKVMQLMADNKALAMALEQTSQRKDAELSELQSRLASALRSLEEQQQEIEAQAPFTRIRLQDLKDSLQDLRISDARYQELKGMEPKALAVLDHIKMSCYEATRSLSHENERLRLSISGAREAAARAEEDAARLRMESARVAAAMVDKEQEAHMSLQSLQTRVERLASELEAATVRCELLAAKGQMYDELRARADRLQEENQRLQVVEASFKRLDQQHHELQLTAQQREHTYEMLISDKAYLAKQSEFLAAAQARLQGEVEVRDAKINELQRQKQELFDQLVQTETLKNKQGEARLQRELGALQASTHADMERIRVETSEAYEREARLLRELRDAAQEEAARAKIALADLQASHESHQISAADVHRRLESTVVELQTELKQKSFELSHFKVIVGEKESLMHRTTAQLELVQEKLQVSMGRCRELEGEITSLTAQLRSIPIPVAIPHSSSHSAWQPQQPPLAPGTFLSARNSGQQAASAVEQEALQATLTAAQKQLATVTLERDGLTAKLGALQAELGVAKEQLMQVGQPHSFLMQELSQARQARQAAELKATALQAAVKAKEQEVARVGAEAAALRGDLDTLLSQRGHLEGLKAMLVRSLGGGGPAGQLGVPPTGPGGGPRALALPTTTIIGEGGQQHGCCAVGS